MAGRAQPGHPFFSGQVQLLVVNHCPLAHFANETTKIYNEITAEAQKQRLEQQLWNIANESCGKMDADECRDYIPGSSIFSNTNRKSSTSKP